jgi:hypothetical protein
MHIVTYDGWHYIRAIRCEDGGWWIYSNTSSNWNWSMR